MKLTTVRLICIVFLHFCIDPDAELLIISIYNSFSDLKIV